jgi:serine phosphatase RsbU (regulator of sigma subunit)
VRNKCLDLLQKSYAFTDRQAYTQFFLNYLTALHRKHKVSFFSPDFRIIGQEFAFLSDDRLAELEAMLPANGRGLNIDYELLNITPLTESLKDCDNDYMPHLILPLRDDSGAPLGVFAFGRAPGLYWQDSQEKAFLALIDVFRGFYINMLAQETLREKGETLVREQEARAYSEKLSEATAAQNRALEEANTRMLDSIHYAELIQRSILPQPADLKAAFPRHFVVWQPRDIVGGDFYWLHRTHSGETVFALVDCTGHGVPGALMAIAADSALQRVVRDQEITDPAEVLSRLHVIIGETLHQQSEKTMQDGMDIALLRVRNHTLTYAGAKIPLVLYRATTGVMETIPATRYSVGGQKWHERIEFESHEIALNEPLTVYLYSDGIIDQPVPGEGVRTRRLGSKAWLEFLHEVSAHPSNLRETSVRAFIAQLTGQEAQRDDICVAGIELRSL